MSESKTGSQGENGPSVRQGYITTSRRSKPIVYNIIIVGETGVGKSSVVELMANVLCANSVDSYDFSIIDRRNETGGSQSQSQTNDARLYEFTSTNGVTVRILDTPGVADTRGLEHDEQHVESIVSSLAKNFEYVDAVMIVANGTVPRLAVSTDYALATLSSILPKSLARNIAFLFTNVPSALGWNFAEDSLPLPVRGCPKFLLNNPLALQKRFLATAISSTSEKQLALMRKEISASELNALDTLTEFFEWLDKLTPQATSPLQTIYEQSKAIDSKIAIILVQMDQKDVQQQLETNHHNEITSASQDIVTYSNYQTTSGVGTWTRRDTKWHNVLCDHPGCHQTCELDCSIPYTVDRRQLRGCFIFKQRNGWCDRCGHSYDNHGHYYGKWVEEWKKQVDIDQGKKQRWESAKTNKKQHEKQVASIRTKLRWIDDAIRREDEVLTIIVDLHSRVALSGRGSFMTQVEKSLARLEQGYLSMQESGIATSDELQSMKSSVEMLRKKLGVLKRIT